MNTMVLEKPKHRLDTGDEDGIMHLATEDQQWRARAGLSWETLCGLYRECLRHEERMATDDPRACPVCNIIYNKAVV